MRRVRGRSGEGRGEGCRGWRSRGWRRWDKRRGGEEGERKGKIGWWVGRKGN